MIFYTWYDEDFRKIFKVKADFDNSMNNTDENRNKIIGFIARISAEENLLPSDPSGVGAIARLAIRWAGRKKKITTQLERIGDVLREADLVAREDGSDIIQARSCGTANADRIERVRICMKIKYRNISKTAL